jgi:hypothetical protein
VRSFSLIPVFLHSSVLLCCFVLFFLPLLCYSLLPPSFLIF